MKCSLSIIVALVIINFTAGGLLGGPNSIDNAKDNSEVKAATDQALSYMRQRTHSSIGLEIKSAYYQIIAGKRFILDLVLTMDNKKDECQVIVDRGIDDLWSVKASDIRDKCYDLIEKPTVVLNRQRRSVHLLGGREVLDLNEQGVQEAANWAVNHINSMSNSMYYQALEKIAEGNRQVVNGYKYRFLLYLVSTTCRNNEKNSGKGLEECPAADQPTRQQCDVSVLLSMGKYSMLHFKCKNLKDNVIGGDNHDYVPHGEKNHLLGGDGHDYMPHGEGKKLMGGDDHDYVPHGEGKKLMGGDDHDYVPHGKVDHVLGGDGHDYVPHGKMENLIGGDYIPHIKNKLSGLMNSVGSDTKEQLLNIGNDALHRSVDAIKKMDILGGDTHDYQPHGNDPCQQHRIGFEKFKKEHQRLYATPQEEGEKFQIFCGNMERVKEYQMMEKGSAVYGATQFADISESEFKEKYLGLKTEMPVKYVPTTTAQIPKGPIPDSWDWREHNAVTPVKNQGSCGSCWAFSTTGNLEGLNAIKHKKLVSLSEQELLDCDKVDNACNGGLPSNAYEAIMKLGGIETEKDYGYEGAKEQCQFKKSEVVVKVNGSLNISSNEAEMAAWLYHNGPISIGINAFAMQFYFGGIAHPWRIFCNPKSLDHGVLIVGYGTEYGKPYWIVKNSWGPSWGRQGYYYVYRGDGTCGLNTMCTSATVE